MGATFGAHIRSRLSLETLQGGGISSEVANQVRNATESARFESLATLGGPSGRVVELARDAFASSLAGVFLLAASIAAVATALCLVLKRVSQSAGS